MAQRIQVFAEDMSDEMTQLAHTSATEAFNLTNYQGKVYSTIANFIRNTFERAYGKGWNCIVGRSFGAYVTHEIKTYMYFSVVPGVCILIWRA
jgi:hypothetical protein